ncbi:MAG: 1-(5-phosphoribosyl)-5-[(5-phosphoribosylamino)methylideneamino]imidazole-4-carboxamide isomerase [Helicobacteraceae bacterium]|jgi:phosphoribosylformimino-5-aminoimidazole carboxamide ribotide isomerase|nr:1-(5-phosphoribosyl)-5-[(5-phosphoribosylamino)methylideneamino]imidazole-4-carboxamide isomerase [Helicobacteraceae bacterium]
MIILPAIDLKDNQAVRLKRGAMNTAKVYSADPLSIAKEFEENGAEWLHIVDLDGAFAGAPKNRASIEAIAKGSALKIELGGGVRDEKTIRAYLDLGVKRVILGSAAAKNPDFALLMAEKYPIAIGIDALDGMVAVEGWAEISAIRAVDFAALFRESKAEAIIATDISRDGMLEGVNAIFACEIKRAFGGAVIASGGVKDVDDLKKLKESRIDGVIIGKAIYESAIDIKQLFYIV